MSRYRIILAPSVLEAIASYRDFIAHRSGSERISTRWVVQVLERIEVLKRIPHSFELAEENAFRPFELRRLLIGKYVATYTIDDVYGAVRVVDFRHGSRLPRPGDLPDDPNG